MMDKGIPVNTLAQLEQDEFYKKVCHQQASTPTSRASISYLAVVYG